MLLYHLPPSHNTKYYGGIVKRNSHDNSGTVQTDQIEMFNVHAAPPSLWADYAEGSFIVLSRAAIQNILVVQRFVPYFNMEDVYIGMLANAIQINPSYIKFGYSKDEFSKHCYEKSSVYFMGLESYQFEKAFNNWKRCRYYC